METITAEALNEAIDDRNFPRPGSLNSSLDRGDGETDGGRRDSKSTSENGDGGGRPMNGFRGPRPRPLDLNGVEKIFSVPGSSQTPRTSTTPGKHSIVS